MRIQLDSKRTGNIARSSILQQTSFWARVKKKHGIESKAFDIKVKASDVQSGPDSQKYITDDVLILFPMINDEDRIGYIPYGPTIVPSPENQGSFLEELSESLRPYLPRQCVTLRYDLSWESLWAMDGDCYNDDGEWMGPPAKPTQEIRLNFDTKKWNLKKPNTNILPSDTLFIDLKRDETLLLQEMKPKTRYNIRLSHRKGVKVRIAGIRELETWYRLYQDTCARKGIYCENIEYFRTVLATGASGSAGDGSQAEVELLIAEIDNIPLAAMFLVFTQRRATYLYGASSSMRRNLMATYALQWEAIRRAKNKGCSEYDMFGLSPRPDPTHPLYGLFRFKRGFGGRMFHRMGCWDYPLKSNNYQQFLSAEMNSTGYHLQ